MARRRLTIALIRFIGTRSARANSFRLTPRSRRSSATTSPGWMGGNLLRPAVRLMVVRDFNIVCVPFPPDKADPPTVVDADAVLAAAVALKGLQVVPRDDAQVAKAGCCV